MSATALVRKVVFALPLVVLLLASSPQLSAAQDFPYLRALLSGNRSIAEEIEGEVRDSIVKVAREQLGVRYRYGAHSPETGFDCSGFVQYVMRHFNISLPRTAALQARLGRPVPVDPSQLRPGDLVTFGDGRRISHIGIYTGNGRYIHANSRLGLVTEDALPRTTGWWRGVRRVIMAMDGPNAAGG